MWCRVFCYALIGYHDDAFGLTRDILENALDRKQETIICITPLFVCWIGITLLNQQTNDMFAKTNNFVRTLPTLPSREDDAITS